MNVNNSSRSSPCPTCSAAPGHFCRRDDGSDRKVAHAERVAAHKAAPEQVSQPMMEALRRLHRNAGRGYVSNPIERALLKRELVTEERTPHPHALGRVVVTHPLTAAGRAAIGVIDE